MLNWTGSYNGIRLIITNNLNFVCFKWLDCTTCWRMNFRRSRWARLSINLIFLQAWNSFIWHDNFMQSFINAFFKRLIQIIRMSPIVDLCLFLRRFDNGHYWFWNHILNPKGNIFFYVVIGCHQSFVSFMKTMSELMPLLFSNPNWFFKGKPI